MSTTGVSLKVTSCEPADLVALAAMNHSPDITVISAERRLEGHTQLAAAGAATSAAAAAELEQPEMPQCAADEELRLLLSVFRELLPPETSDEIEKLVEQILLKRVALTAAQFLERVQNIAHAHLQTLRWASYIGRMRLLAQGWQQRDAELSQARQEARRRQEAVRKLQMRRPCFKRACSRVGRARN